MELKKSYKGLVLLVLLLIVIINGVCFLPEKYMNINVITRIVLVFTTIWIALLTFVIYKTEYVYWYNGVSYEDAVKAGQERRREYAYEHFKRFGIFAAAFTVFSVIAAYFGIPFWIDMVLMLVGEVWIAIGTIKIKL